MPMLHMPCRHAVLGLDPDVVVARLAHIEVLGSWVVCQQFGSKGDEGSAQNVPTNVYSVHLGESPGF